ncbi:MAG: hypothetical protein UX89_C0009G0003 [Parcubacteria group bacterium GW2011_GWA2_47_16]|nr:MAG: hypothetical protein UX89_C0009G0003 [Parcubacteria group bacterium GW2011_GWA2_47_16]
MNTIESRRRLNAASRTLRSVLAKNKQLQEKMWRRLTSSRHQYLVYLSNSSEQVWLLLFWGAHQHGLVLRAKGKDRVQLRISENTETGLRNRKWWDGKTSLPKIIDDTLLSLGEEHTMRVLLKDA